jgi:glycosyltransferase involved in cell wall biosynthesis
MRDRPFRVAITARAVAPWHGRGGLERHVADLVQHLAGLGIEATLIVPPPRGGRAPIAGPDGAARVTVVTVPYVTFPFAGRRGTTVLDRDTAYPLFGWRAGRAAAGLARRGSVDVVHGLGASALGYAFARRRDATLPPLVLNPQGLEEFGATDSSRAGLKVAAYWPLQRAVRACARAADAVIATDRVLVPVVMRHLGVDAARVAVIPNAVDLARCDRLAGPAAGTALRSAHGIDPAIPLLLSVGRIEENKGFHVLAASLASLVAAGRELCWVIVGDGPFRQVLDRLIAAGPLRSRTMRAGTIADEALHAWYEAADLFVHPTLYEGSSLVTLEAMAHRRPVVATRAGGLPDKVQPGVTGWLVEPGDPHALAAIVAQALDARTRWRDLGEAGRKLAEREFAWPAVATRLVDLYERLTPAARWRA